jgi:metal-responsive CopG/Arc/MetJ family transcriptional regulator
MLKKIIFNLEEELLKKIDKKAKKEGNPRSTLIRRWIVDGVNKE